MWHFPSHHFKKNHAKTVDIACFRVGFFPQDLRGCPVKFFGLSETVVLTVSLIKLVLVLLVVLQVFTYSIRMG